MKITVVISLVVCALAAIIRAEPELFVFDNGLKDVKCPEEQASLLQKLGYKGICTRPDNATPEFLAAMDHHGIRVTATFLSLEADSDGKELSDHLKNHILQVKDRKSFVWLAIKNGDASDEAAVSLIRRICDLSAGYGLEVVLYPHIHFKLATPADCERFRKLADRPNLGTSFALCHFLALDDVTKLETTLRMLSPHLKLVQISGADIIPPSGKPQWQKLIQPLGQGSFDMTRVMRALESIGYNGPVNLQCYDIKQPAEQHLAASMQAWKKLNKINP